MYKDISKLIITINLEIFSIDGPVGRCYSLIKEVWVIENFKMTKGHISKDKIMNASMELISENGIENLSAKKIADKAGISKSNVFHHYKSVSLILEELFAIVRDIVLEPLKHQEYISLEDYFEKLSYGTFVSNVNELKCFKTLNSFYSIAMTDEKYKTALLELKESFVVNTCKVISKIEGIPESELRDVAEVITITIDGFGQQYLIENDQEKYIKLWEIQSEAFCNYIRKKK